jgi:hypothetical protein
VLHEITVNTAMIPELLYVLSRSTAYFELLPIMSSCRRAADGSLAGWLARSLAVKRSRRQTLRLLAGGLGGLVVSALPVPATRADENSRNDQATISYPAGWNLVGGPGGSTLVGATGNLYTLQPGDSSYQTFPANTPLQACWGYWAFFPNGGSLVPGVSQPGCEAGVVAGQRVMVGNASTGGSAPVDGADQVLTYTPAGGYQAATAIPVGAGAWVFGNAAISIEGPLPAASTPATAPRPSSPPAAAPTQAPTPIQAPVSNPPPSSSTCYRHCTTGIPCGNSCISSRDTCHQPPGCAC